MRDAVAECTTGSERVFLIRYKLPVAPGDYVGSYQVSGSGGYRVYCEYHDGTTGRKRFYRTSGSAVREASASWETRRFTFSIPSQDAERIRSFAFVISVEPGANVRFKAPSLQYTPAKETPPASSAIGGKWTPADGGTVSGAGKSQELRQIGHARPRPSRLCGIPATPGKTYRFTCRTRGIATADAGGFCAFRIVPVGGGRELIAPVWDDTLRGERQFKHLTFTVPEGLTSLRLRYLSTGHGGWDTGDEFVPKENVILIDGQPRFHHTPWRSDCGTFRTYNPASGNFWNGMSSSDYSRSGWCPGTATQPVYFDLTGLTPGEHTITIAIPQGQREGTYFSAWNVSGVLIGLRTED